MRRLNNTQVVMLIGGILITLALVAFTTETKNDVLTCLFAGGFITFMATSFTAG